MQQLFVSINFDLTELQILTKQYVFLTSAEVKQHENFRALIASIESFKE